VARLRWFAQVLPGVLRDAWWDAFLACWADLGDQLDPDLQRVWADQARDRLDAHLCDRGGVGGDAAGTGGAF